MDIVNDVLDSDEEKKKADLCRAHRRRPTRECLTPVPPSAKIAAREQPPLVLSSHLVGDDSALLAATANFTLADNFILP